MFTLRNSHRRFKFADLTVLTIFVYDQFLGGFSEPESYDILRRVLTSTPEAKQYLSICNETIMNKRLSGLGKYRSVIDKIALFCRQTQTLPR